MVLERRQKAEGRRQEAEGNSQISGSKFIIRIPSDSIIDPIFLINRSQLGVINELPPLKCYCQSDLRLKIYSPLAACATWATSSWRRVARADWACSPPRLYKALATW